MHYFFRRIIFGSLFFLYSLGRLFWRRSGAAVLMYHSVSDDGDFFSVPIREFSRQMEYISRYRRAVTVGEVMDFIAGKKVLSEGAVAVTFDDGYFDFKMNVLPVLKKYRIPAVVFVLAGEPERSELGNNRKLLAAGDIKGLSSEPLVEIGSHGMTHNKLTRLPQAEAENEIRSSRVLLQRATGRNVGYFAYPKGNFNGVISATVRNSGYRGAFSAVQRISGPSCDEFAVPRLQIDRTTSFVEFKAKLTPAADWYYWLWSVLHKLF